MLGSKIKEYLDAQGIKYSYVADKIGMPNNTFSALLNGKREVKATEYFAICDAIHVPLEQFAPGE